MNEIMLFFIDRTSNTITTLNLIGGGTFHERYELVTREQISKDEAEVLIKENELNHLKMLK